MKRISNHRKHKTHSPNAPINGQCVLDTIILIYLNTKPQTKFNSNTGLLRCTE
jgi:hypothetical protein